MEAIYIIIIAVFSVLVVASAIILTRSRKVEHTSNFSDSIFGLFKPNNIKKIEFIRNKVVVTFSDITLFDVKKLQEYGGKGISVIGDKIKFFISDNVNENETLYHDLLKHIER